MAARLPLQTSTGTVEIVADREALYFVESEGIRSHRKRIEERVGRPNAERAEMFLEPLRSSGFSR